MQSKKFVKALSLFLSLCFVFASFASSPALAASTSSLKDKKSKIQSQIDEAEKKISKLASEKKETQEYIAALDKKIQLKQDQIDVLQADANELQSEINSIESSIDRAEKQIEKTQKEIDKKQAQFDKTYDEYCQRLKAMYVSGHASNLEVLLTSTDISSILTRSQMIKSVSEKDSETLDYLMVQMEQIEKDKAELEAKINKLSEDKKKLEKDKKELTSQISTIESSKRELDNEVAECNALIRKLSSQSAEYQESIEENESALRKVEAEIQAAYARASRTGSTGSGAHSGALGYPTDYRSISAGYPNYSSGRYHGGVDFPCPSGSNVYAAASGTVIVAKNLNYSYGHYLIVDHGNGLSTLYAHNTTLLVGVGSHVNKGQIIARSGSTGNSTGPHCHFEVRVNGTRVNPLNYL
ncbi:MAG: peptidoglycan DD-metalloendopeptidase family protein [Eubacterium sp.]|nr:peptidoglycan DD-metalloendopeptidase family protein [Eubacterium sp.]